jgi:hypothetical protein
VSVTLTIAAETLNGAIAQVVDHPETLAAVIAKMADDTLLEAVRKRFRLRGLVVNVTAPPERTEEGQDVSEGVTPIAPIDPPSTDPATKTSASRRQKNKEKAPVQGNGAAIDAPGLGAPASAPTPAARSEQTEQAPAPTKADVVAALDAFAVKNSQAAARAKLQEIGGTPQLSTFPTDKYGALLEALRV